MGLENWRGGDNEKNKVALRSIGVIIDISSFYYRHDDEELNDG